MHKHTQEQGSPRARSLALALPAPRRTQGSDWNVEVGVKRAET